jgi:polysaccharide biosynthesis transport protein
MDLGRFVDDVRSRLWLIAIATAVAAGAAFALSTLLPKEYEAEAGILVGSLTDTSTDQLAAYRQLAQTYVEVATSDPVLERVITKLKLSVDPRDLAERLDVRTPAGQPILRIKASGTSPAAAADLANAVAEEIKSLARIPGTVTSLATIFQPASVPDEPATPRVLLNTVIAAALGLAFGIGLALVLANAVGDRKLGIRETSDEARQAAGRP